MHHHILVPVALDHEAMVGRKIELARRLLAQGGRMTLLTVLEDVPGFVAEFVDMKPENHIRQRVRERLEAAAGGAEDIACDVITGKAGIAISRYAAEHDVDLIVVGSHKPGVEDYFLGSTASRVVRRAPCSVHVLR